MSSDNSYANVLKTEEKKRGKGERETALSSNPTSPNTLIYIIEQLMVQAKNK